MLVFRSNDDKPPDHGGERRWIGYRFGRRPSPTITTHPPHYMSMMRSPDWWDSGELTGDWSQRRRGASKG
jgi:hypothetical protein